jgi:5-methylthioadenosine/S-adenosylhomocysteine deaminase
MAANHITLYRACHVFPVSTAPILDGAVVVADGRIQAVGAYAVLAERFGAARMVDLGESALLPAAVNAHTHLELTGLAGRIPAGLEFAEWIIELVRVRRQCTIEELARAAADGAAMARAAGTAALGEISTLGLCVEPMLRNGLRGVVYYELLGTDPAQAPELLRRGQERVRAWRLEYGEDQLRFGLSLHTPYTVSAELFRLATRWCGEEQVPLSIHAAESPAESLWLHTHNGPITERLYRPLGLPLDPSGPPRCSAVAYLDRLGVLAARPLLAHGVQVDASDLARLTAATTPVAHCPRSNEQLLCGRMPYGAYRAAGVAMALGTDSLASSPSLSVWDELAAAYDIHAAADDAPAPADLLRLATLGGAEALGLAGELGSLEVGKCAELVCVPLTPLDERDRGETRAVLAALCTGALVVQPVRA